MYYLFIENMGRKRCVMKAPNNNFSDVSCSNSLNYPSNIIKVEEIEVHCLENGQSRHGVVFVDYITGMQKLNLTETLGLKEVMFK